jgi:hypothetical protein
VNPDLKQEIGAVIVEDLLASGTIRSCVNCERLVGVNCALAGQTPPPSVVMRGCESWLFAIPF